MPQCNVTLTQVIIFLSLCPKSNTIYITYEFAKKSANKNSKNSISQWLNNAETKLMKETGYSKGYKNAYHYDKCIIGMQWILNNLKDNIFYNPSNRGEKKDVLNIIKNIKK